jgi:flagella basal body P-ring formation protein FlgA
VETTDLGVAWTRSVREVFGKTARHDFASGAPLSTEAFAETPTVRRGDTVNLRLERDGIVLTSTAKAVDDGRMGDVIRVKSTAFSSGERVLRVRVAGRSAVTVQ